MKNFMGGLLVLGAMAQGGFLFILVADALKISFSYMGLYCLAFSALVWIITCPYYLIIKKRSKLNKGITK